MNLVTDDEIVGALERAMLEYGMRIERQRRKQQLQQQVPRPIHHRQRIFREHEVAVERLYLDYFVAEPRWGPTVFRRRFRMLRDLFLHIANTLQTRDEYFQQRPDACGRPGLSTLQKCTTALRQLAYGRAADMFDEYLHVADTTGRECLKNFRQGVVEAFSNTYMRKPNTVDFQFLLDLYGRAHGFPGMLGSIDCMH